MAELGRDELQKRFLSDYAATGISLKDDVMLLISIMQLMAQISRNLAKRLQKYNLNSIVKTESVLLNVNNTKTIIRTE